MYSKSVKVWRFSESSIESNRGFRRLVQQITDSFAIFDYHPQNVLCPQWCRESNLNSNFRLCVGAPLDPHTNLSPNDADVRRFKRASWIVSSPRLVFCI